MKISVVIPTWRRPSALEQCLQGLEHQDRTPDEVLIIVRHGDEETKELLEARHGGRLNLTIVTVGAPGLVAALNRGLEVVKTDVVAFTDDDTVPRHDWLKRIERHFATSPGLGGLGGRDHLHPSSSEANQATVGKLSWFGRMTGNHHLGVGAPRPVDLLKGANMSYRAAALDRARVDERLRGGGVQLHTEVDLCFAIKSAGWKLVYDPAVSVDHYPARRFEDDSRSGPATGVTLEHVIHNETYLLLKWLPWWRRLAALAYWHLIGSRVAPGLVLLAERLFRETDRNSVFRRYLATLRGRATGMRTFISTR